MLSIGSPAPAFSLPDQDGKPVTLSELAGRWVVLYFYPRDDTPGCTIEACEFTSSLPNFRTKDAEVFGCSADSASAHLKFIAKHELGIRLLTDADKRVMNAYGAFGKKVMYGKEVEGVIRSTVLIDPEGKVAYHWPKVSAAGHAALVLQKLAELRGDVIPTPVPAPIESLAATTPAKKPTAKKPMAKKAAAKKAPAAKKPAAKKLGAKKPAAKKPAPKKAAAKKSNAKAAAKPAKKPAKKAAKKSAPAARKKARR